ncbi:MAG: hypothetical protein ACLVIY_11905 [Anaerobutyricum soehngenii]
MMWRMSQQETMEKGGMLAVSSEPPVDEFVRGRFPKKRAGDRVFSVEFLPGRFPDQRADSAVQRLPAS